jgi:hypothetical protein
MAQQKEQQQQLQQYIGFMLGVPQANSHENNNCYHTVYDTAGCPSPAAQLVKQVHLPINPTRPLYTPVEARSVTLIAPNRARPSAAAALL